ncbi:hypothetical protein FGO68_gene13020 [Halteria grandinella]|uniref:Uncharacterized protein n=1 Tax=Halteria grandinella TaxID=5974 RepID=A0A8J8NS57_HALGN|nr:hypothetical protein FGO68_gene13020 [Halteria grandinella]
MALSVNSRYLQSLRRRQKTLQKATTQFPESDSTKQSIFSKFKEANAIAHQNPQQLLQIIDNIYQENNHEVEDHLVLVEDDLRNWCQNENEPPNYLLSILDRVKRYKEVLARKHTRDESEKTHQALTPEESYAQLVKFCKRFNIHPEKVLSASQAKTMTRMKLIESLCLNVDNSFLKYKQCGNVDETLTKMKLLKPKLTALKIKISDKLEEEARELETLRKHKIDIEHRYLNSPSPKNDLSSVILNKQFPNQYNQHSSTPMLRHDDSSIFNKSNGFASPNPKAVMGRRLKLNDGTPTMSVLRSLQTNGTLKNLIASGKDKVASSLDFNPRQKKQGKYSEINRSLPNIPKMIVTPSNPRDEYSDPISIQRKTASPSPPPIRYSTFKAKQQMQSTGRLSVNSGGFQEVITSFKNNHAEADSMRKTGMRQSVDQLVNRCKNYEERYSSQGSTKQKYYVDSELLKQRIRHDSTVELADTLHSLSDFKPAIVKAFHAEHVVAQYEESTTQRKVVDSYNMRKLDNISGGYYMMLERGQRKKRIAMATKKKRLGAIE